MIYHGYLIILHVRYIKQSHYIEFGIYHITAKFKTLENFGSCSTSGFRAELMLPATRDTEIVSIIGIPLLV